MFWKKRLQDVSSKDAGPLHSESGSAASPPRLIFCDYHQRPAGRRLYSGWWMWWGPVWSSDRLHWKISEVILGPSAPAWGIGGKEFESEEQEEAIYTPLSTVSVWEPAAAFYKSATNVISLRASDISFKKHARAQHRLVCRHATKDNGAITVCICCNKNMKKNNFSDLLKWFCWPLYVFLLPVILTLKHSHSETQNNEHP